MGRRNRNKKRINMNSKNILLQSFRDQTSQSITASDLRSLVIAIYDEFLLTSDIIERDDIFTDDQVASISITSDISREVQVLKDQLKAQELQMQQLEDRILRLEAK